MLPRLVRYRNIRNKFAHDVGSIRKSDEISKADIKWVRGFNKDLIKKRDPISTYLRKARRYARRRRFYKIAFVIFLILIAALAGALYFALSK